MPDRHLPKPPEGSPFFVHRNGQWCKKIKGKHQHFGSVAQVTHDEALIAYDKYRTQLEAGILTVVPKAPSQMTVGDICNLWTDAQNQKQAAGRLADQTLADYREMANTVGSYLGANTPITSLKAPAFNHALSRASKRWGTASVARFVTITRMIFKWGYETELIDLPIRFGTDFKQPSAKERRLERFNADPQLFSIREIARIVEASSVHMRAMILLGLNCGFGQKDCSDLVFDAIKLDAREPIIDWIRPKTGTYRKAPLWPETVDAIKASIDSRRRPAEAKYDDRVFLTVKGLPWVRNIVRSSKKVSRNDSVNQEFKRTMVGLDLYRPKRVFYSLRKTFRTVADEYEGAEAGQAIPAINLIMGHVSTSMGDRYVQRIRVHRLKAVTDYARSRLVALRLRSD